MDSYFKENLLKPADVLLILPPFAYVEAPSIGLHILQACAEKNGFSVQVGYINMIFSDLLGSETYNAMCSFHDTMIGEAFFADIAYGTSPFTKPEYDFDTCFNQSSSKKIDKERVKSVHAQLDDILDKITDGILQLDYKVIGCSTTFNQTSASIALLNRIKSKNPNIITMMGGSNCEREMGEGILSLSDNIDYVFSGKSEETFPSFLKAVFHSNLPKNKIIQSGEPVDVEDIPLMDYTHYYEQMRHFSLDEIIPKDEILLLYETSRGCWWGQKHQCNFCGLNGDDIVFNQKSCDKIIRELKILLDKHPSNTVIMVDSIMPYTFIDTLIPMLLNEIPDIRLFYEVKSNMPLEQLIKLKKAGVFHLQPGIEGLSSSLLKRMSKGTTAKLNVMFLKNVRSLKLAASWNLLYAFPGDTSLEYEETLSLLPLISHFEPPKVCSRISLQRFSNYFEQPEHFGISQLMPIPCYDNFLPQNVDADKLAYDFVGEYKHFSQEDEPVMIEIKSIIEKWQKSWEGNAIPKLHITKASERNYMLMDTRGLPGTKSMRMISYKQALAAIKDRPITEVDNLHEEIAWAKEQKLIIELDGWYVSLITAEPEILIAFKNNFVA